MWRTVKPTYRLLSSIRNHDEGNRGIPVNTTATPSSPGCSRVPGNKNTLVLLGGGGILH